MAILILAEPSQGAVKSATLSTVAAAQPLPGEVHVLVAGEGVRHATAAAAAIAGVTKVLAADHPAYAHALPETIAPLIASLASGYSHILAPATTFGKNVLPRAAALLDVAQISDITAVISPDTFKRPIYAGNAIATVQALDPVKLITVRTSAFATVPANGGSASVELIPGAPGAADGLSRFVGAETVESEGPDLSSARIVVSGGRGLGSAENFKLIEALAGKLGAAVGASRAAVDAGFVSNDLQVGQTGKIVAPELYIAVGISGAIQHLAGMKDSKVIVAINKDEEAPIFQISDYCLVGDLFQVVPELTNAIS